MNQGDRLRKARKDKKLSQEALADLVGVSRVTITQLESGKVVSIDGLKLLNISDELGINPRWLLTGKGTKLLSDLAIPESSYSFLEDKVHEPSAKYNFQELTGDEITLLINYRNMTPSDKRLASEIVARMSKDDNHNVAPEHQSTGKRKVKLSPDAGPPYRAEAEKVVDAALNSSGADFSAEDREKMILDTLHEMQRQASESDEHSHQSKTSQG